MDLGDRIQMNRRNLIIRWLYVLSTPLSERGGLLGLEQGCYHLPAIATNRGIELHLNVVINPGTTPVLTSTTLAFVQGHPCLSRALVLEHPIKEDETKP